MTADMTRPPRKKRHTEGSEEPDAEVASSSSISVGPDAQSATLLQSPDSQPRASPSKKVSFAPEQPSSSLRISSDQEEGLRKPRLVITKMVLNNFKSYAGRQVIGPFHKSFSAIVGPNGSGKSNVIDSLLFVFGYRANKMRQGKLSELIHNSAKYPNIDSCSVEIHFQEIMDGDEPDKFEVVPNSRLVVSRHAFRSNSSKYYINDRTSSFTQVTDLLRSRGIDLDHKRFLILQGEVESIALMKAKAKDEHDDGLLEYLEDIIGTSKYKDQIEASNSKLDTLNEERLEKYNRARYVKREKDSLEDKKAEAENYLENENDLARKKNELYQIYLYEANENIDVAKTSIAELETKLEEQQGEHSHVEQEVEEKNTAYQNTVAEYKALEANMAKIQKRSGVYEKEEVQLREKKDHLLNKQTKGTSALTADREARDGARESIKQHTEALLKRKNDLKELEKQLKQEEKKLDEINSELKGRTDEYLAEISELQRKLAPWTEKINEKKKAIEVRKSESEILAERISSGEKAVEEAEKGLQKIKSMLKSKQAESKSLPGEIENLRNMITELEDKLKDITEREASCRSEVNSARQKADEARSSMQQSQTRGKVLDSLLRMRDSGRIKGIHDRLGNLGVIDDKYDVAISTACSALDNIVVDTVEAGQACIEYLRKNNLGRAVFTILNQLRTQDTRSINTPEQVPRLFDLIQPKDERFRSAFYNVLKDTLVAKDLQQANRIAYGQKRWRVVTLDGKLIEMSGAMSGGGNRQMRGAMGSRFKDDEVSAETVAKLERERDKLEAKMRDVVEEKRTTELALQAKKDHLPRKEVALEKLRMDMQSLERQVADEKKRLVELKAQTKPSPEDVLRQSQIEEEITQLGEEMEALKSETADIEEKIHSLQEDIMEAGGMDLRLQKIVVDDVRKRIDALNNKITKTMVAKAKAEKDVTKLETSISKTEKECEKNESELKALEQKVVRNSKEIAEITKEVNQFTALMETKKAETEAIKKELDEKTAMINGLRQSKIDLQNSLEDYKRNLVDNEKKAVHWKEHQSKLTLQRVRDESDEELELPLLEADILRELQDAKQSIKGEIAELEAFVQSAKPNLSVLEEYRRREEEYNHRAHDLDEITKERDTVKDEVEMLRKQRLDEFMQGFNIISQKLKEMYQMITLGGNAELELVDSLDPFSEGIVFSVMPPKKSWKNISNLSGGEKTLSSLALVFALHHFKPTPLYVMDEIDAALDFRNVSIVANYIAARTKDAQFVIISLRNNMFELADRLVGIYKTSDCTKSIAINPSMVSMITHLNTGASQEQQNTNKEAAVA